jgi:hypothetical protein
VPLPPLLVLPLLLPLLLLPLLLPLLVLLDELPLDVELLDPLLPPLPVPLDDPPLLDPRVAPPPDTSRPVDAPQATTATRPTRHGHRIPLTTRFLFTGRLWPLRREGATTGLRSVRRYRADDPRAGRSSSKP